MSRKPPLHKRETKPLPRAELAPISSSDVRELKPDHEQRSQDDIQTMARCPLCSGHGMVAVDLAVTFRALMRQAKKNT